jgi:hypothetical protein
VYWHKNAQYLGVVLEVAHSRKAQDLNHLAEDYIADSDGSISVVLGLDIEYGKRNSSQESLKATLSVWRTELVEIDDSIQLRPVQVVKDKVCLSRATFLNCMSDKWL